MWTEERVEMLAVLWKEGLSASQVAKRLGGCSRNAVIGKVHRLGLPLRGNHNTNRIYGRATPKARSKNTSNTRTCKVTVESLRFKPEMIPEYVETVDPLNIPLAELQHFHCRAITDDSEWGRAKCCGHNVAGETSWCADHLARFTTNIPVKRRKRIGHDYARREDFRNSVRWGAL